MPANTTRINLSVTREVLAQIDRYCDEMGVSRSAAFCVLAMQSLKSYEGLRAISEAVAIAKEEPADKAGGPRM